MKDDDTIYCDWCGEFPYYISIYDENQSPKETLLCKRCYNEIQDDEDCLD